MNKFKERLLKGEELIGFEVDLAEPCISEMAAACGFDFIWVDTEHQAQDYETVLNQIIACKAGGAASLVRIPQNEPFLAKRVLEMGPDGIIFPNVNSAHRNCKRLWMPACIRPWVNAASVLNAPADTDASRLMNTSKRLLMPCVVSLK